MWNPQAGAPGDISVLWGPERLDPLKLQRQELSQVTIYEKDQTGQLAIFKPEWDSSDSVLLSALHTALYVLQTGHAGFPWETVPATPSHTLEEKPHKRGLVFSYVHRCASKAWSRAWETAGPQEILAE